MLIPTVAYVGNPSGAKNGAASSDTFRHSPAPTAGIHALKGRWRSGLLNRSQISPMPTAKEMNWPGYPSTESMKE